jgi:TDG/mug DNA glycosylase family protein
MKRSPPTKAELLAAKDKIVPDLIAPGLDILFCGINPGLYTAAVGHHFARPGNRFWPTLHVAGFTPTLLTAFEEKELLKCGYGITNVVMRATVAADELSPKELQEGGEQLKRKVKKFKPKCLAVLGMGAYRSAFGNPKAKLGRQSETWGDTVLWVLPNPSGLNAAYKPADFVRLFRAMRLALSSGVKC